MRVNVFSDIIIQMHSIKFYQRKLPKNINTEMYNQSQNVQYIDPQCLLLPKNFITVSLWILTLGRHNRRDKSNEMLLSSYICTARLNEKVLQI